MTDSLSTYRHDCDFCDVTIAGSTLGEIQSGMRSHLADDHYAEFEEVFVDRIGGKPCFNKCGYTFPSAPEDATGFECPNCGHDNFAEFADRHVWWHAEVE